MEIERTEPVPSFRSFWEKSKREAAHRNLTFVQVEHGSGAKGRRRKRQAGKSAGDIEKLVARPKSPVEDSRRQQVYQAQKRHRNRKAEYAKSLKTEKAKLLHLIALMKAETEQLSAENETCKTLLLAQGHDPIQIPSRSMSISTESRRGTLKHSDSTDVESRRSEEAKSASGIPADEAADPRVSECRTLLLQDVEAYGSDEDQEKAAWDASTDQILSNM